MSFVTRQAAHCDQCSHEWLVVRASNPTHCAKCKSRRWNAKAAPLEALPPRTDKPIQFFHFALPAESQDFRDQMRADNLMSEAQRLLIRSQSYMWYADSKDGDDVEKWLEEANKTPAPERKA